KQWLRRATGVTGDSELLSRATRAIDNGHRPGSRGRRFDSLRRRLSRRIGHTIVVGVLLAVAVAIPCGLGRRRLRRNDRTWLAAQGIIDEGCPRHHDDP